MKNNYLEKLEYNKILDILSNFCVTNQGKEICLKLLPANNYNDVKKSLDETNEAISLLYRNGVPPISEISDIEGTTKILETYGILSIKDLLNLANIFKISDNLKDYFFVEHIEPSVFPILNNIFSNLYSNNSVVEKIFKSIIDENTIDDSASKTLQSIRKKQRNIVQDIKDKLNNILHSSSNSKYIQENVVTIRNNRYVIPVKEEYRSMIKGFIHDVSSSGSTVFIEPISVFELNNEFNNLKIEENIEIEKILQDLSKLFYPYVHGLKLDVSNISNLDFIFAKARYAKSINGNIPNLNIEKIIVLNNAKHPLLDQNTAVPISLTLGQDFNTLVITGPNTGGKTVTLKTVGLLTCMACSGLGIPADGSSSIFVFDKIFADIGDNQSIADSLSTFSSHMSNIVNIIDHCNENSLVLVDELGSGTDPIEGAALAISILEYIEKTQALTIATTHYQELKKYALVNKGFENASVEFDLNTLSPTFKLLVGVPGKSNAFEISKHLGLNSKIIDNAKSKLNDTDIHFEELLKNIYDNKISIEKEKEEISKKLENISEIEANLKQDNEDLIAKRKEIINNAKIEARKILLDAKEESNQIIKSLVDLKESANNNTAKSMNSLRNELNKKIKDISLDVNNNSSNNNFTLDLLNKNTDVFVKSLNSKGKIISKPSRDNDILVQVGDLKISVSINDIEILNTKKDTPKVNNSKVNVSGISKSKNVSSEINVIGLNVEEATFAIDKFLDDCSLAKLETVHIIHGKGTGKLREGIHKFLKTNPHVKSFRLGTFGEGEMGVTVVTVKK